MDMVGKFFVAIYDSHQTARGLWPYKRQFGFGGLAGGWPGAGAVRRGFRLGGGFFTFTASFIILGPVSTSVYGS